MKALRGLGSLSPLFHTVYLVPGHMTGRQEVQIQPLPFPTNPLRFQ